MQSGNSMFGRVGVAAGLAILAGQAAGQTWQFKTPHVIDQPGPFVANLGGTTFVNEGLVGVGRSSASALDAQGSTLGSGSSLALAPGSWSYDPATGTYSGRFLTLPDRGRNDPNTGNFLNYQGRIEKTDFSFAPLDEGDGSSQDQIALTYVGLTLLAEAGGAPTVGNDPGAEYGEAFGRKVPRNSGNITIDCEGLNALPDGSYYVSDEYGSAVYHFDADGVLTGLINPPEALFPRDANGTPTFTSTSNPKTGRRGNQGMEGVGITPDGRYMIAVNQSGAMQDSGGAQPNRRFTRVLVFDISNDPTPAAPIGHYVLELPTLRANGDGGAVDKTAAQSEIVALSATQFLMLSRDSAGRGGTDHIAPAYKTVLLADVSGATNLVGTEYDGTKAVSLSGVLEPGIKTVPWVEAVNILNLFDLGRFGLNLDVNQQQPDGDQNTLSEKWEGMTLAPDLATEDPNDYFLFVTNDNDYITTDGTMVTTDGEVIKYSDPFDNDNVFLAYRVRIVSDCYADFNGDGTLDLFDFLAFVNVFNATGPGADCDGNVSLDLFDFLCFVNAFNAGC